MGSNDSPEIPDRGRHQTSPASLRGTPPKVSVRDQQRAQQRAVLNHPNQLAVHISETSTTGKDLRVATVVSVSGTGTTADRYGPFSVVS